jgi:hypothetical protein
MKIYIQIEECSKTLFDENFDSIEEAQQAVTSFEHEYEARLDARTGGEGE